MTCQTRGWKVNYLLCYRLAFASYHCNCWQACTWSLTCRLPACSRKGVIFPICHRLQSDSLFSLPCVGPPTSLKVEITYSCSKLNQKMNTKVFLFCFLKQNMQEAKIFSAVHLKKKSSFCGLFLHY